MQRLLPLLERVEDRGPKEDHRELRLHTERGTIETRLYDAEGRAGAIFVGGVGGGFDSPSRRLYERLSRALPSQGVTCLRVRFRFPTLLDEAVHDVLAGVALLSERGKKRLGLVGHSFGGAVVVSAAAASPGVGAVVTLATQAYGADAAAALRDVPILVIHGSGDRVLPASCSTYVHALAPGPKELRVFEGAGHGLDEVADEVYEHVERWLTRSLPEPS